MTDRELLEQIAGDVTVLKEDVTVLKEDVTVLKDDVSVLKDDVTVLKDDVTVLKDDVSMLKDKVDVLNNRTTRIELTLENDVAKKINVIGEGHGVLDRRFQESQVIPSRVENLELKMIHLETEIEKLKAAQ